MMFRALDEYPPEVATVLRHLMDQGGGMGVAADSLSGEVHIVVVMPDPTRAGLWLLGSRRGTPEAAREFAQGINEAADEMAPRMGRVPAEARKRGRRGTCQRCNKRRMLGFMGALCWECCALEALNRRVTERSLAVAEHISRQALNDVAPNGACRACGACLVCATGHEPGEHRERKSERPS